MSIEEYIAAWLSPSKTLEVQTSGSTGRPKCITVEKERMRASARMTCDFLGLREGQTALLCMSVDYIAGKMMVVRALERGLRLITTAPSGHPLKDIDADIDLAAMVPMQVWNSLQEPTERAQLQRIRHLIIGGGAVSPELEEGLHTLYDEQCSKGTRPTAVWSTYGMTETLSHIALRRLSGPEATLWYTPLPGISLSQDAETQTLIIDAPALCTDPLHTHDIVHFEDNDSPMHSMPGLRFRILGRTDNTVCSGGVKIQIEEVETLLQQHLGDSVQLTSRPDPKFGEVLVLLTTYPINENLLHHILREHPYWYPKEILYVTALPRTATGKPDRTTAKHMATNS